MRLLAAAVLAVVIAVVASPVKGALLALLLVAGWFVLALVKAHRRCSWCGGTRRAPRWRWWGPVGPCRKCRATGEHPRWGAGLAHRVAWSVAGELLGRRESREG